MILKTNLAADMNRDAINRLSNQMTGAAIEVHRIMGPGLLESAYEECLGYELEDRVSGRHGR